MITDKIRIINSGYEVSAITKNPVDGYITHIAGVNEYGNTWKLSLERAIMGIEEGDWQFYIGNKTNPLMINITVDYTGKKYLYTTNNFLSDLPECDF